MTLIRLSVLAEADIVDALAWSERKFGPIARRRYERLIVVALEDLAEAPQRAGSHERPELGAGATSWHLQLSRERARTDAGIVRRPRHVIIYRLEPDGVVAVGRVLHDAMELTRRLPTATWP